MKKEFKKLEDSLGANIHLDTQENIKLENA